MTREELVELALQGSKAVEDSEEATNLYVDIAEHLLRAGHASTIGEIDVILRGMTIESAEAILSSEGSESLYEGHKDVATGDEVDAEGYMVLRQMATAKEAIMRIETYIGGDKMIQLPSWVQAKLAIAAADLDTIGDYLLSDTEPTE